MGPYDSTLQMFVQKPQPIDMSRLSFMRWLAEQGKLEHPMAGPSSGPLVGAEGGRITSGLPTASAFSRFRDRATKVTADSEGWLIDGVTPEVRSEAVLTMEPVRFRR